MGVIVSTFPAGFWIGRKGKMVWSEFSSAVGLAGTELMQPKTRPLCIFANIYLCRVASFLAHPVPLSQNQSLAIIDVPFSTSSLVTSKFATVEILPATPLIAFRAHLFCTPSPPQKKIVWPLLFFII